MQRIAKAETRAHESEVASNVLFRFKAEYLSQATQEITKKIVELKVS